MQGVILGYLLHLNNMSVWEIWIEIKGTDNQVWFEKFLMNVKIQFGWSWIKPLFSKLETVYNLNGVGVTQKILN